MSLYIEIIVLNNGVHKVQDTRELLNAWIVNVWVVSYNWHQECWLHQTLVCNGVWNTSHKSQAQTGSVELL